MRIANDTLIDAPADLSSPWTSKAIWLGHVTNYSIQLFFTGTPEGSFKLQCSSDAGTKSNLGEAYIETGLTHWTDIANSTQAVDEAGDHTWQVENAGYPWVRVVWAPTSGTGSLTSARFNTKGI